jgi:AcrR family transcriptional regulator
MEPEPHRPSARRDELLDAAYRYVLEHGLAGMSLRPLAAAIGSSPRVLLFLFGSKDGLIRALLARARADELALVESARPRPGDEDLAAAVRATWSWLTAPAHRQLLGLWLEAYARSLTEPDGPWAGFARQTVDDWLAILEAAQPRADRRTRAGRTERTLALAAVRGALLDMLATGDVDRTTAALERLLGLLEPDRASAPPGSAR